jgi:hypothetical protein
VALVGESNAGGLIVTLPKAIGPDQPVAFTATGRSVQLSVLENVAEGLRVRVEIPFVPVRIVVIGTESLGENADARQNARIQSWSVNASDVNGAADSADLALAVRLCLLADASCSP